MPHENTLSKPKEDRLNLMRACSANFSQVFGLYDDENLDVSKHIYEYKESHKPDITFKNEDNIREALWKLSDDKIIKRYKSNVE